MKLSHLLFFLVFITVSGNAQSEWKLKRDQEDMKVYYRKSADSKVNEIKIETTIDASAWSIITVLNDVESYPDWIYKCEKAEQLKLEPNIYYSLVDFPWPLNDRDFIARSTMRQDPKSMVIYIDSHSLPDYLDEQADVIRIGTLDIKWKFTPISREKTRIEYQLQSDPGGIIPAWLINLAVDQGPINTINGLRERVKLAKYRNAEIAQLRLPTH